jgi:hypothetical protein
MRAGQHPGDNPGTCPPAAFHSRRGALYNGNLAYVPDTSSQHRGKYQIWERASAGHIVVCQREGNQVAPSGGAEHGGEVASRKNGQDAGPAATGRELLQDLLRTGYRRSDRPGDRAGQGPVKSEPGRLSAGRIVGEQRGKDVARPLAARAMHLGHAARISTGSAYNALGGDGFGVGKLNYAIVGNQGADEAKARQGGPWKVRHAAARARGRLLVGRRGLGPQIKLGAIGLYLLPHSEGAQAEHSKQ